QDTHHDFLAEQGRQGADAEIDGTGLGYRQLQAAVLRHALLGNVQARNHLDAGSQLFLDRQRRLGDLAQHAIDPETDLVILFERLEMQVRRAHADRVDQDLLQEAYDRRVIHVRAGGRIRRGNRILLDEIDVFQVVA